MAFFVSDRPKLLNRSGIECKHGQDAYGIDWQGDGQAYRHRQRPL